MEWIQSMMQWARTLLEQVGFRPVALPLSFVLGLASAIASACCTLPLLGAIVGYSGTREDHDRRARLLAALFFMLGTTIALVILGAVAGFVGQVAQDLMGKYWKVFAGLIAIFVGLAALKLLPFKLPTKTAAAGSRPKDFLGAAVFGLVMGGGVVGFSLPLALIVLGASFGKSAIKAERTEAVIRIVSGILLLSAGFYFLATF
jgi:cytochrome c biogenesis protein CcdA